MDSNPFSPCSSASIPVHFLTRWSTFASGHVDGTLVRGGGGSIKGADLELLDAERSVVAGTRPDFDGFFLFDRVPYGPIKLSPVLAGVAVVADKQPSAYLGAVEPASVRAAGKESSGASSRHFRKSGKPAREI
jgi:hypothetical protein